MPDVPERPSCAAPQEYTANESTMRYLRDHDRDTVWATFHACGAQQLAGGGGGGGGGGGASGSWGWTDEEGEGEGEAQVRPGSGARGAGALLLALRLQLLPGAAPRGPARLEAGPGSPPSRVGKSAPCGVLQLS